MQRPEISVSFLLRQTCRNCQLPVTCGPVYVINDLSILCGRCRMLATDHFRNFSYEALASIFQYPCINWQNHCPVRLQWNESLVHEQDCCYTGCCTFLCTHPGTFLKGRKSVPHDDGRLVMVPEHVLDYLKCVLCEGYLNCEPIYIQTNGQNICHRCVSANGIPPNCRRNYAYENLSRTFVFPCIYRNRGCPERMQPGRVLWQHESDCPYGPGNFKKTDAKRSSSKKKEKGVVKTHSGHIWATLTPNTPLFAPPDDPNNETNKELMKSLAIKQGRQIRRADDIVIRMGRTSSETESVSTNCSDAKTSLSHSGKSTPDILNCSRPSFRESRQQQKAMSNQGSNENGARSNSRTSPEQVLAEMAGHYPVLIPRHLDDDFQSLTKWVSKKESFKSNRDLINELKIKQDQIKRTHSIKGENDVKNPYQQCNNFEDIRNVHNQLK